MVQVFLIDVQPYSSYFEIYLDQEVGEGPGWISLYRDLDNSLVGQIQGTELNNAGPGDGQGDGIFGTKFDYGNQSSILLQGFGSFIQQAETDYYVVFDVDSLIDYSSTTAGEDLAAPLVVPFTVDLLGPTLLGVTASEEGGYHYEATFSEDIEFDIGSVRLVEESTDDVMHTWYTTDGNEPPAGLSISGDTLRIAPSEVGVMVDPSQTYRIEFMYPVTDLAGNMLDISGPQYWVLSPGPGGGLSFNISVNPLDSLWVDPVYDQGTGALISEGYYDFANVAGRDILSLIGETFTTYGYDFASDQYGLGDSLGVADLILPEEVRSFAIDQDGFVFEGRESFSEGLSLVGGVENVVALFNESQGDSDAIHFYSIQGDDGGATVASGIRVEMGDTDAGGEFKVTRVVDGALVATVSDVEQIRGTNVDDFIFGDDYQNVLEGRGGDDFIVGGHALVGYDNNSLLLDFLGSWNADEGIYEVTVYSGYDGGVELDLSNPIYYASLITASTVDVEGSAIPIEAPIAWTLVGQNVNLDGNLVLEFLDLHGNASAELVEGVTTSVFALELALDESGAGYDAQGHFDPGLRSGGTEWLVGGTGADIIISGASQSTVLVDLDVATMVGGVGKDTFVVRGQADGDSIIGGARIDQFQVSDYTTSLGGNLGNARDVITFNVSLGWLAAAGLSMESLDAFDRLTDGQNELSQADRVLIQQALQDELSVVFVPDETSSSQSIIELVDSVGNIGAFATLWDWILPTQLTANSTFASVLVDSELVPPIGGGLWGLRANDATAFDIAVLDEITLDLETYMDGGGGNLVTGTEWDLLVLGAYESVTGLTVTANELADLSPVLHQAINSYDFLAGLVDEYSNSLYFETVVYDPNGTPAESADDITVDGIRTTDLINELLVGTFDHDPLIDTRHIFEDTVNLSFAIVGERANTVHGLQDNLEGKPGLLQSRTDESGKDVDTIFTPGRADEVIASGQASDTFEFLRQDFDGKQVEGTPETKGNFGQDVIVDFAGSAASDTARDLLLIQGVDILSDNPDTVGGGHRLDNIIFSSPGSTWGGMGEDTTGSGMGEDTTGGGMGEDTTGGGMGEDTTGGGMGEDMMEAPPSMIFASRTTLGNNSADSSLRVEWTGDAINPGGDVTLYRQYDPTTDRFRVEDVQLGDDTYSLGQTDAVRDVDGNIIGSIYTTDAPKSILVGSDNVQETFSSSLKGPQGTMIIGGFQGSDDLIDLSDSVFTTFNPETDLDDNGDGTFYLTVHGQNGEVMEIFLQGTFNEEDLLLAGT
jgi:hypothetical protein